MDDNLNEIKKMDIEIFNKLNKQISDIMKELEPFIKDVSITTAKKNLMEAGKNISESFYRYEQKEDQK